MSLSRRHLIGTAALASLSLVRQTLAQPSLLPLDTPGLDHLDVIVPDVEKTARFYMGLLKTTLHAQPFQGGQRYFVLLGPLPDNRAVGYLAIGDARGRGTYIGHFCTSVVEWRRDSQAIFAAMADRFAAAGLGDFPGPTGVGGIFEDPDGIEIQFLPAPDTLVTAAVPSALVAGGQGLLTPLGVDHVLLNVTDLERALVYYRILYGAESGRSAEGDSVFAFRNGSRLLLRQGHYAYGSTEARIARFGLRVAPFDRDRAAELIVTLGGTVLTAEAAEGLRFKDVDGAEVVLVSA